MTLNRFLKFGILVMLGTLALTAGEIASGDPLIQVIHYFDGCSDQSCATGDCTSTLCQCDSSNKCASNAG